MQGGNDTAFGLLCQLVEGSQANLHPDAARYSEQMQAYERLVELGALAIGDGVAAGILCPWCGSESLDSVRFGAKRYQGYCTDCGWVDLEPGQVQSLRVDIERMVRWIAAALGLAGRYRPEALVPGYLWRLGEMERRRKRRTVFFGRRLADPAVAPDIERQLGATCAPGCGVVVTTTSDDSPILASIGHLVVPLRAVAHLRKAGFVIENLDAYLDGTATPEKQSSETSLRLMHLGRIALIEGEQHHLSPQVYRFLCVLEEVGGEPVHKRTIADALEMDVDKCKGADICKRHKAVYRTFVGHDAAGHYWLKPEFVSTGERR